MGKATAIAWCHHSRSFWQGCTKVSVEAGGGGACDNCYAEARDKRLHRGVHWGAGAPRLEGLEAAARDIRAWNRAASKAGERRAVFVNQLSDFFDNEVPQEWRDFAFRVFKDCLALDFILLTKRPANVMKMVPPTWQTGFPENVRLGITVCNQAEADRDIPVLIGIPARCRFLSIEPQLGPINLVQATRGEIWRLHWVIQGGESGHHARHFDLAWARALRDQCKEARVPYFLKQIGMRPLLPLGHSIKDRAGADPAEWPLDLLVQEFPR
jgi:protein gp37